MFLADLHIHSHYARATSRQLVPEMLALWGRRKGLGVIGTGDFTHPGWRAELADALIEAEPGLYRLRTELADPDKVQDDVLKTQTGASAVIHKGKNVQVVYGLKVNAVRKAVDAELGLSGEE